MRKYTHAITNDTVTVTVDGKPYSLSRDKKGFEELKVAVRKAAASQDESDWAHVMSLLSPGRGIQNWSRGAFTFSDNTLHYEGDELPRELHTRILAMARNGDDPRPLMRWWERMRKNPSHQSKSMLFKFIENQGLPILPDGTFLAWKGVRPNYTDWFSGTFVNKPGAHFSVDRNRVSDNPRVHCAEGFHAGSKDFAKDYAKQGRGTTDREGGHVMVVKIDPQHVVCVPDDSPKKVRLCDYWVLGEEGGPLPDTTWSDDEDWGWREEPEATEAASTEPLRGARLYQVRLTGIDPTKLMPIVRAVRELALATQAELKAAKALVEAVRRGAPQVVQEGLTRRQAEEIRLKLIEAGGEARVFRDSFSQDPRQAGMTEVPSRPMAAMEKTHDELKGMTAEQLAEVDIGTLRAWAARHLFIIGASKIPGGKPALIQKILHVLGK